MRPLPSISVLIGLVLALTSGCSSKQDSSPTINAPAEADATVAVPNLDIGAGVTIELVSGVTGFGPWCRNEQGEEFQDYPVSDVVYRIQGEVLEKVENVGCPATTKVTPKNLTLDQLGLVKLALADIKTITVETKEDCVADSNYVGIRLKGAPEGEQFVHIVPRSRGSCKGDFVTIVDWQGMMESFDLIFSL